MLYALNVRACVCVFDGGVILCMMRCVFMKMRAFVILVVGVVVVVGCCCCWRERVVCGRQ